MQPITIATEKDIPALIELVNAAYRTDHAGAWTTEAHLFRKGGKRIDGEGLKELMETPGQQLLTYMKEDKIRGCVCLMETETKIHLGMLAVDPASQGMGIGKKLLLAAADFARKRHKSAVALEVITARTTLIAWYERFGFRKTGHKIPFPATEQALSTPIQDLYMEEMILPVSEEK